MIATYALLALAVLSLWPGVTSPAPLWRQHAWLVLLGAAVVSGLVTDILRPVGLLTVAAFTGLGWVYFRATLAAGLRVAVALAVLAFAVALMLHRVPGFANPKVIDAVRFTADARPFSLYLNFDKTLVGLALIGWGLPRLGRQEEWGAMLRTALPVAGALTIVLFGLSLAAGYVRWAPKFPAEAWLWLGVNLGFVCLAEEALFRGFLQEGLQRALARFVWGRAAALGLAAVMFGLAHAAGGAAYVALSAVAGIGYGWAYQRTGRIEASMTVHGIVNTVHFFGFTYPALA